MVGVAAPQIFGLYPHPRPQPTPNSNPNPNPTPLQVDLAKFLAAHEGGRIDGVALHRAQSTVRKQARGRAQMGSKRSFLPMR